MKKFYLLFMMSLFAFVAGAKTVTDVITPDKVEGLGASVAIASYVGESGAVYSMRLTVTNDGTTFHWNANAISYQLWTDTSVGYVRKVTLVGGGDSATNITIYGQHRAWTIGSSGYPSDVTDSTLLATTENITNGVTVEQEISGIYEYIDLYHASSGIVELTSIAIEWEVDEDGEATDAFTQFTWSQDSETVLQKGTYYTTGNSGIEYQAYTTASNTLQTQGFIVGGNPDSSRKYAVWNTTAKGYVRSLKLITPSYSSTASSTSGDCIIYGQDKPFTLDGNVPNTTAATELAEIAWASSERPTGGTEFDVTIEGDYPYIAISGPTMTYFDPIYITWELDESIVDENPGYTFTPQDGAIVQHLDEFSVAYESGISCSEGLIGQITVTDEQGSVVAHDASCETIAPEDDPDGGVGLCTITLDTYIRDEGTYTVNIPEGYFIVGEENENSKNLVVEYYVDGWEVSRWTELVLGYQYGIEESLTGTSANPQVYYYTYTASAGGQLTINGSRINKIEAYSDDMLANKVDVTSKSSSGGYDYTYTIDMVAGTTYYICVTITSSTSALFVASFTQMWTANDPKLIVTPADGSSVYSLSQIVFGYEEDDDSAEVSGLGTAWGSFSYSDIKVSKDGTTLSMTFDNSCFNDDDEEHEGCVVVTLPRELTENGTYTIIFPTKTFFILSTSTILNMETHLTYIVDDGIDPDAELYATLCGEVEALSTALDEAWTTIETDYPDLVEELSESKNAIAQAILDEQATIEEAHDAGSLSSESKDIEAAIAAIQAEIDELLAYAAGIDTIAADAITSTIYTLTGQKVAAPTAKGIYIVNGKKVYIK